MYLNQSELIVVMYDLKPLSNVSVLVLSAVTFFEQKLKTAFSKN